MTTTWATGDTITAAFMNNTQRRIESIWHVGDYSAVGDGTTDDTAAVQAALTAANAAGGGEVWLDTNKKYYIASNLTIPAKVTLRGYWNTPGDPTSSSGGATYAPFDEETSAIRLASTATISIASAGGIKGVLIYKYGLTFPQTDATNFSGTAITITGDDVYVGYCMIVGFALAITSDLNVRPRIEWVFGDNIAGIKITRCYDVARVMNCHFWPFATYRSGAANADHHRTGTGIEMSNTVDLPILAHNFVFGYLVGFKLVTTGGPTLIGCDADSTGAHVGSIGYDIGDGTGGATAAKLIGCTAYSIGTGYRVNLPVGDPIQFVGCSVTSATGAGISLTQGDIQVTGCFFKTVNNGIVVSASGSTVIVNGCRFESVTIACIANSGSSRNIHMGVNDYQITAGNAISSNMLLPQVASAATLLLPATGSAFEVTGTTNIGNISGGWAGRVVFLKFAGILTVNDGGATIALASNFTTSANDTLTLVHDGTTWNEIARSTN
jgi:hypothetical protein